MKPNRRSMQAKTERNESLIKDYKKGMLLADMMDKYKISKSRIYQILPKY